MTPRRVLSAAAVLAAALSGRAEAQGAARAFSVPAQPLAEALIAFAVQGDVAIGGQIRCRGLSRPLAGRFTPREGLERLLSGTACDYREVAPGVFRIVLRPPPPPPAPEAPADPERPAPVPELVVTATRRAADPDRLPYAVSVIGQEALARSEASGAGDVASQLPNLTTTNLGPGRDKILLRGMSDGAFTGRTQSTVAIYLDHTPVTYNAPDPDLRLTDVEAVEVLRGPQGTLYGGGAVSGVYRIVSRKPDLLGFSAGVRAGVGLAALGEPSYEAEGFVNLPLGRRAGLRVVGYSDLVGGQIQDVARKASNVNRSERNGGRAAARLEAGDWTFDLSGAAQTIRTDDTQYISPDLGRFRRSNTVEESHRNRFLSGARTAARRGGPFDAQTTFAYVQRSLLSRADATNALPLFGGRAAAIGLFDERIRTERLISDTTFASNGGGVDWLGGVFASALWQDTRSRVVAAPPRPAPGFVVYNEDRSDRMVEAALYGEASVPLNDRWTLTAGTRAAVWAVRARSLVLAPDTAGRRTFQDEKMQTRVSPKAALHVQLPGEGLAYALVSQGYRSGGFNTGGRIGFVLPGPNPALAPFRDFHADSLWNFEAGLKAAVLDGRLRLRGAVFHDLWRDLQSDQFMPSGLSYTANIGDGRNTGLEVETAFAPTPALSFQVSMLANRPRLTHVNPGVAAQPGVALPGVPQFALAGRATYERDLPGIGGELVLSAEAQYVGRSRLTFDPMPFRTPMGGYVLSRVAAQLRVDRWRFGAAVINPADLSGNTFSYGNPFNYRQARQETPQRPRTLQLSVSAAF